VSSEKRLKDTNALLNCCPELAMKLWVLALLKLESGDPGDLP